MCSPALLHPLICEDSLTILALLGQFPIVFFPIVTFSIYAISNITKLDVARALPALSIISLMSMPLLDLVGNIPSAAAAASCFDRIQQFLMQDGYDGTDNLSSKALGQYDLEPITADPITARKEQSLEAHGSPPRLQDIPHFRLDFLLSARSSVTTLNENIVNVAGADIATNSGQSPILKDIDLDFWAGSLSIVNGPVGSGKTTLLQSLLGENALLKGTVSSNLGSVAYCSQEPWLFNTTIRDNILFGYDFDHDWYEVVLHACSLDQDTTKSDLGDQSMVGSGGVNLSGGQKQRVVSPRCRCS